MNNLRYANNPSESRLLFLPEFELKRDVLHIKHSDGRSDDVFLYSSTFMEVLGRQKYTIDAASTVGRKNTKNQDFVGVVLDNGIVVAMVADGVGSKAESELMSEAIVTSVVKGFRYHQEKIADIDDVVDFVWRKVVEGVGICEAREACSTFSCAIVFGDERGYSGRFLNLGDSRIYWATDKRISSADVHSQLGTGKMTRSVSKDNLRNGMVYDLYKIDGVNELAVFLCTGGVGWMFDGVHFPKDVSKTLVEASEKVQDHISAVSIQPIRS